MNCGDPNLNKINLCSNSIIMSDPSDDSNNYSSTDNSKPVKPTPDPKNSPSIYSYFTEEMQEKN